MSSLADEFPLNSIKNFNHGVSPARQSTMLKVFGEPRQTFNQDCQPVTNPTLKQLIISSIDVGPFSVTGLRPAVESLQRIMQDVKSDNVLLYNALGTAGMLCCRYVRGSTSSISNHSWGTAIDIKINGKLDPRGDNEVQYGLTLLATYFNRHGWFWGAGFRTEDGMHFEVSDELIRSWVADGTLSGNSHAGALTLSSGDRGPDVRDLQRKLKAAGFDPSVIDGDFGPNTKLALTNFQQQKGLDPSGTADHETLQALGLA